MPKYWIIFMEEDSWGLVGALLAGSAFPGKQSALGLLRCCTRIWKYFCPFNMWLSKS